MDVQFLKNEMMKKTQYNNREKSSFTLIAPASACTVCTQQLTTLPEFPQIQIHYILVF